MDRFPYMPLNGAAHGGGIDSLMSYVHWLMLLLFVGWGLYFVFVLFRFRAGANPTASYSGVKGKVSKYIEIGVALVEAVLLLGFSIPIWAERVAEFPAEEEATVVRVVAQQFAWNVHYAGADGVFGRTDPHLVDASNVIGLDRKGDPSAVDDIVQVNQLHLPVDRPVIIKLSTLDVIHSFFLPQMRVKQDAIPGMEIPLWFQPTMETPEDARFPTCAREKSCWEIACAQLCGNSHYRMRGFYTVHSREGYQQWLAENAPKPPAVPVAAPTAAEAEGAAAGGDGAGGGGGEPAEAHGSEHAHHTHH